MAKFNKIKNCLKAVFVGFFAVLLLGSLGGSSYTTHADFCSDVSSEFGGFLECDEKFSSFSSFRGGIKAPTGDGLDPTLTQTDSAQDFVLNIANFALGFLGMIAILVIVYSGFLYVTSAVDDSNIESAKNNIKYSLYGILVIMGSYAIVNTVIQAPGGDSSSQLANQSNLEQLDRFNSVAFELKDIARDMTQAYEIYRQDSTNLKSILATRPSEFNSRKNTITQLQRMRNAFINLEKQRGALSNTGFLARDVVEFGIDPVINDLNGIITAEVTSDLENRYKDSPAANLIENIAGGVIGFFGGLFGSDEEMQEYVCSLEPEDRPLNFMTVDCENAFDAISTGIKFTVNADEKFDEINYPVTKSFISKFKTTGDNNEVKIFNYVYNRVGLYTAYTLEAGVRQDLLNKLTALTTRLEVLNDLISSYPNLKSKLKDLITELPKQLESENRPPVLDLLIKDGTLGDWGYTYGNSDRSRPKEITISNFGSRTSVQSIIASFIQTLSEIHTTIENAKFTVPVIDVNVVEGSAPLVVTFDASGSYDPSNRSVLTDSQDSDTNDIQNRLLWDINGNGSYETSDLGDLDIRTESFESINSDQISCNNYNAESVSLTCTFKQPGSFRVGLLLKSLSQTTRNQRNITTVDGVETANERVSEYKKLENILTGIAYQTIRVKPPTSRINLVGYSISNEAFTLESLGNSLNIVDNIGDKILKWFNTDGILLYDNPEIKFTLAEASSGITFDASFSEPSENLKRFSWRFSDRAGTFSGTSGTPENLPDNLTDASNTEIIQDNLLGPKITRNFDKRGRVQVQLEVEDNNGNLDRKMFDVVVGSLVARLRTNKTSGFIGEEFTLSAEDSRSDFGSITYEWKNDNDVLDCEQPNNDGFECELNEDKDVLRFRALKPEDFNISVEVSSESAEGVTETASVNLDVNPRPLEPLIVIDQNSLFDPAKFTLNASLTSDPDEQIDNFDPAASYTTEYEWKVLNGVENTDFEPIANANQEETEITFLKPGTYRIGLKASKVASGTDEVLVSSTAESSLLVSGVMNLELDNPGAGVLEANVETGLLESGEVVVTVTSRAANRVTLDFGDGSRESLKRPASVNSGVDHEFEFTHTYALSGSYKIGVFAESETESKALSSTIIIGGGDTPTAVIAATVGGNTFLSGANDLPDVFRKTRIEFDASKSLNLNGTNKGLKYSWDLGDGTTRTQKKFIYNYKDYPPLGEPGFDVTLTITDAKDPEVTNTANLFVPLSKAKPSIENISAESINGPITPFDVRVKAVGPYDADGRIETFRYYYFPLDDPEEQLGVRVSKSATEVLRIGTRGDEGEEVDYGICIDVIDNEGIERKCEVMFLEGTPAVITAVNGQNKLPSSKFRADKSSVKIGESVTFFDQSFDPDGTVVERKYDILGDGSFANDEVFVSRASVINYDTISPRKGFRVVQQVVDHKGGVAVSNPIFIYVESNFEPPEAAFVVEVDGMDISIQNNSQADSNANISGYVWDFDVKTDSDGNDVADDDSDSTENEPNFTYTRSGQKTIKLTVTDNEGNVDTATETIEIGGKLALPRAAFNFSRDKLKVVTKNNSEADFINGGEIVSYEWDFDIATDSKGGKNPANNVDSTSKNPVINYDKPGTYTVALTVEDNEGNQDRIEKAIAVQEEKTAKPQAAFTFEILDDKTVEFTSNAKVAEGSNLTIREIYWDFNINPNDPNADADGNGSAADDKQEIGNNSPSFTYDSYGVKRVSLTVTDSALNSDTVERIIEVPFPQAQTPTQQAINDLSNSGQAPQNATNTPTNQQVFPGNVNPDASGLSADNNRIFQKTPEQIAIERELGITQDSQTDSSSNQNNLDSSENLADFNPNKFIITEPAYNEFTDKLTSTENSQVVTFKFDNLPSEIIEIQVDSNVYVDTSNDGIFNNDVDFRTTNKQDFTTTYTSTSSDIRARVTLIDNTGVKYYDSIDIEFKGLDFSASLNLDGDKTIHTASAAIFLTGASALFVRLIRLF
ncbi:PKD domain-containing protein [bacterium]|nr:PKD domain-containing protein [bacterium]